jgi:hypothetical protein
MNPTICTVGKSAPREKWRMTNDEAWGNEMASLQTPWNTVEAMTTAKTFCQQATKRRASDVPSADKVDTSTTSTTYSYGAGGKESPIPGYVIRNLSPSDFLPESHLFVRKFLLPVKLLITRLRSERVAVKLIHRVQLAPPHEGLRKTKGAGSTRLIRLLRSMQLSHQPPEQHERVSSFYPVRRIPILISKAPIWPS